MRGQPKGWPQSFLRFFLTAFFVQLFRDLLNRPDAICNSGFHRRRRNQGQAERFPNVGPLHEPRLSEDSETSRPTTFVEYRDRIRKEFLDVHNKHFPNKLDAANTLGTETVQIAGKFKSRGHWTGHGGQAKLMALEPDEFETKTQGGWPTPYVACRNEFGRRIRRVCACGLELASSRYASG